MMSQWIIFKGKPHLLQAFTQPAHYKAESEARYTHKKIIKKKQQYYFI